MTMDKIFQPWINIGGSGGLPRKDVSNGIAEPNTTPDGAVSKPLVARSDTEETLPRVFRRRWLMLCIFCVYSLSNAFQWIHLNIIGDVVLRYYNSSLPGSSDYQHQVAVHWLSMVFMLAYIPLILPATWLLDRHGLRRIALLATLLNALGAWIKCTAVHPDRFGILMFGQTVAAVAQVFILGIPARLAAVWFGPDQVSTATAIGVFGNQLGCAVGFLIPPALVPNLDELEAIGQRLGVMMYGTAGFTTAIFVLVIIVFQNAPPIAPSQAQAALVEAATHENYMSSLKRLFSNRGFCILMITYGINTGSYYAIGTLLNPIVIHYFPGQQTNAGVVGLVLVLTGVLGSILAGLWLDRTKLFKVSTVGIYLMSCLGMLVFSLTLGIHKMWLVILCSAVLGFFMTGYLPVGFEFAAEITYPESEGTSSGLLNASAQIFGIVFTLGMGVAMNVFGMLLSNIAVSAALLVGTILTVLIKSDLRRQSAGQRRLAKEELIKDVEVEDIKSASKA